jgi:hypothetical protein
MSVNDLFADWLEVSMVASVGSAYNVAGPYW